MLRTLTVLRGEVFEKDAIDASFGLANDRNGNDSRSVGTLLRYVGTALAELRPALRLLKALQA